MTERAWVDSVGESPFRVVVGENLARGGRLYLRWWLPAKGNWTTKTLDRALRTPDGKPLKGAARKAAIAWALAQAEAKRQELIARAAAGGDGDAAAAQAAGPPPLTIGETKAVVTDPATGRYRTATRWRYDVEVALDAAARVWGADRPWASIRRRDFRALWRAELDRIRAAGHEGLRTTQLTLEAIVAVANWLRDEELIPEDCAHPPSTWKQLLKAEWSELSGLAEPVVHRPRYTADEYRRLLAAAETAEPRMALLVSLGAEIRLGQVVRARRSALDLAHGAHGAFQSPGRTNKRGALVLLTAGQRRMVDHALGPSGYLHALEVAFQAETLTDYPLFPGGLLVRVGGKPEDDGEPARFVATVERHAAAEPLVRRWIGVTWKTIEAACDPVIPHITGRGPYGMKRTAVDLATDEGISDRGLQEHGGWTTDQMPKRVYRDQQNEAARREAAEIRAKIRGEQPEAASAPEPAPAPTGEPTGEPGDTDAGEVEAEADPSSTSRGRRRRGRAGTPHRRHYRATHGSTVNETVNGDPIGGLAVYGRHSQVVANQGAIHDSAHWGGRIRTCDLPVNSL